MGDNLKMELHWSFWHAGIVTSKEVKTQAAKLISNMNKSIGVSPNSKQHNAREATVIVTARR